MKTNPLLFFLTIVFYIGFSECNAQQLPTSSGGDLTGVNGTISYSVGQSFYITNTGSTGFSIDGVQQPYEISEVLSSEDFTELISEMLIYPNPTMDLLTLKMTNQTSADLKFQLIDINGKILRSNQNLLEFNEINVSDLQSAIYFLQILNQSKVIKSYKIIKN